MIMTYICEKTERSRNVSSMLGSDLGDPGVKELSDWLAQFEVPDKLQALAELTCSELLPFVFCKCCGGILHGFQGDTCVGGVS